MPRLLTSPQNPLVKQIALLSDKAAARREQNLFVAEGLREVGLALQTGYVAEALLYDEVRTSPEAIDELIAKAQVEPKEVIRVNTAVMEKIAYRAYVPNVVGLFQAYDIRLSEVQLSKTPLILVLETVEKPGNLGAILRTADAAGVDAVILCDPSTDWFNPNVIRASLGAVFTVPCVSTDSAAAYDWLRKQGVRILATYLEASVPYYTCDLRGPTAFVLGSESAGISDFWIKSSSQRIIIPMHGAVDSPNVLGSTAVVLFEALREREKR